MADSTRLRDRITRDRLLLAAVLVAGIAGTGIVRRQLGVLGYNDLGRLVYILGYGTTVFLVWYGWIRPIDITGPTADRGAGSTDETDEEGTTATAPTTGASDDESESGR